MDSPCNKICVYDPLRKICSDCGRTLEEIAGWSALGDDERRRIMAQLPERLSLKPG